jgi:hypothetical protein
MKTIKLELTNIKSLAEGKIKFQQPKNKKIKIQKKLKKKPKPQRK